jgi:hypothetical protein
MLLQPHFEGSVRSPLTLPKMGLESPLGLPKTQSSIAGVKTPRLEVFFIPLERSWSVNVETALHEPFRHLQHKLCAKEGSRVKLAVWLPTTKSRISTRTGAWRQSATHRWKGFKESYKFALDLIPIGGLSKELWAAKVSRVQTGTVSGQKAIWMWPPWSGAEYTIWGKVVASPESGPWWVKWV